RRARGSRASGPPGVSGRVLRRPPRQPLFAASGRRRSSIIVLVHVHTPPARPSRPTEPETGSAWRALTGLRASSSSAPAPPGSGSRYTVRGAGPADRTEDHAGRARGQLPLEDPHRGPRPTPVVAEHHARPCDGRRAARPGRVPGLTQVPVISLRLATDAVVLVEGAIQSARPGSRATSPSSS